MRKALAFAAAAFLAASSSPASIPKKLPDYTLMQQAVVAPSPLSKSELERAVGATHARSATCALNGYDTGLSTVPGSGEYVLTQFNQSSVERTGIAEFLDIGFTLGEDGGVRIAHLRSYALGEKDGRYQGLRDRIVAPGPKMSQALERMVGDSVRGLLSCDYDSPRPMLSLPATRQTQDLVYGALVGAGLLSREFLTGASTPSRNK